MNFIKYAFYKLRFGYFFIYNSNYSFPIVNYNFKPF